MRSISSLADLLSILKHKISINDLLKNKPRTFQYRGLLCLDKAD